MGVILQDELDVEVWLVKKKKKKQWHMQLQSNDTKYKAYCWSWKEFSVARVLEGSFRFAWNARPITVLKSGEILFLGLFMEDAVPL